jgi:peptide/nickel transport system substrate-binding protein
VTPNGTSTCQRPGTGAADCGAGIKAGQPLEFQLLYSSGSTTGDEEVASIQSSEAQAGVAISLKAEPFNSLISTVGVCNSGSHPASTCGWQLVDFGYDPYDLYPSGDGIFNTDSNGNQGGYSSAEEDSLISETEYGGSAQTFFAYEDYTAEQLPWLWVPLPSNIQVYKSNLVGYAPLNPFTGGLNPEDWYYSK